MMKTIVVAGVIVSTIACGAADARDRLGAVLGGAAIGAVGGVILGSALSARAAPAPVYLEPPTPQRVTVEEVEPVRHVVERSPWDDRAFDLHERCDAGDRHACVRFGILIGQHREHVAEWRRSHPDYFSYED